MYDYTVTVEEWQEESRRLSEALPLLKGFCYYAEGGFIHVKLVWNIKERREPRKRPLRGLFHRAG